MGALRECMDTGVRSSGAMNARRLAKDALKRALHEVLDRVAMRLALPTGERRTVIRDDEFQPSCHSMLVIGDQRTVIGSEILLFTDHRSLITFAFHIGGVPVQIALQNHLSCYLVDVASGVSCLLSCITQGALGCDGRYALVPGNNRAWQNDAQLFYKLKDFSCSYSDLFD